MSGKLAAERNREERAVDFKASNWHEIHGEAVEAVIVESAFHLDLAILPGKSGLCADTVVGKFGELEILFAKRFAVDGEGYWRG